MEQVSKLDNMYAMYKLEFEDVHTIFKKDIGFANYKIEDEGHIYIQEVYVKPSKRGNKYASMLTNMVIQDAKENYTLNDSPMIFTTIGIGGNTVDLSIRAITAYGFKLFKSTEELIYFYKNLDKETDNE